MVIKAFKAAVEKGLLFWNDLGKNGICLVFSLLGIVILIAAPVVSVQIPLLKAFSVAISTFGGALGMLFLASAYWINKYRHYKLDASKDPEVQKLIKKAEARAREELEREIEKEKNEEIKFKLKMAEADLERYNTSMSQVNNITLMAKMLLLEMEVTKPDFLKTPIQGTKEEIKFLNIIPTGKTEYEEYLGLILWKYTALYGIDHTKLRFAENERTIHVTGITVERIGFGRKPTHEEKICQRRKITVDKNNKITKTLLDDDDSSGMRMHLRKSEEDLERGERIIEMVEKAVKKSAENYIRLILSPFNKEVEFSYMNTDLPGSHKIKDFFDIAIQKKIGEVRQYQEDENKWTGPKPE